MGSYTALSYQYMWRKTANGGDPVAYNGRGAKSVILDLLQELSMEELLEVSASAATAAAKRYSGAASAAAPAKSQINQALNEDKKPAAMEQPPAATFCARRPFHPGRLDAALRRAQALLSLRPAADDPNSDDGDGDHADGDESRLSLHGLAWLATQNGLQALLRVDENGVVIVEPGDAWWAGIPKERWPFGLEDDLKALWVEPHGDRQTEIFLPRPVGAKEAAVVRQLASELEAALVTDAEWEDVTLLDDPFADHWEAALRATEGAERAARIADEVKSAFGGFGTAAMGPLVGFGGQRYCPPCGTAGGGIVETVS